MDELDTVGLSIGNDPDSLHKTNQIDLIAILENNDNNNTNLRQDANDCLVENKNWIKQRINRTSPNLGYVDECPCLANLHGK